MAENPDIKSKTSRVSSYYASAWTILEGIVELISIVAEISGQVSVMAQVVKTHERAGLFVLLIIARPLAFQFMRSSRVGSYYCMLTDSRWLRMNALFDLGTDVDYKKEVIADNLEGYINSQYDKDMKDLGDTATQDPFEQISNRTFLSYSDFDSLFDSLPLAGNSLQNTFWRVIHSGTNLTNLCKNTLALYEVLRLKPAMVDGTVVYPEEKHKNRKGTSIEFKSVNFQYPMTDKVVLKDMSFSIKSGQLCVIVGENGCGKSTTINMITRMYDCTSGEVLVDGRPIGDYVVSSFRAATSIMYQDYHHLPLTIRENILLGRPDCENPTEAVEEAAKMGGAYDFIAKLPLKFETNIKPNNDGYSNSYGEDEDDDTTYQKFIDAQKDTKLSGGEWQRLALSKTFMKNSDKIRLLCYDEPSASLDPKAEYEMFERLRNLRGDKTMIFVTHRFGHLTKYADLILYVKEGSIVEKGTHRELLAMGGEYAKMYNIQSQAFVDGACETHLPSTSSGSFAGRPRQCPRHCLDSRLLSLHAHDWHPTASPFAHSLTPVIAPPSVQHTAPESSYPEPCAILEYIMVIGRLTHYAVDLVLVSTVLAGVKKSTGYTPQTSLITDPTLKSVADTFLGAGETVFNVVQGNAVTSAYFKREG
ncbi:hypothetical protein FRC10_009223 [Ceratobasidium sp. 414]|nr:hypothetical protein FRC10_009223 [Ceratobasidium sp. 414]